MDALALTGPVSHLRNAARFARYRSGALAAGTKQSHILMSTPSEKTISHSDDSAKSGGIEPKYLAALGVFLFAALYDFFITHGGQPYLAHPPTL